MNNYQSINNVNVTNNVSAIIQIGMQQYKVSHGDIISVQLLKAKIGKTIRLNKVLSLTATTSNEVHVNKIGAPILPNCVVEAVVLQNIKLKKQLQFKSSPRNNDKRQKGINQPATILKITKIGLPKLDLNPELHKIAEKGFKISYKDLSYLTSPLNNGSGQALDIKHFNLTKNNLNKLEKLETQKR